MNEGYVVFVNDNEKYLKLLDVLIESVLCFSEKPIEVFSINFDYHHSSDRVFSKKITLPSVTFETICYSKLYSTFNSRFDYGIQLDGDFIITKEMDKLFLDCYKIKELPLGSVHPSDPNNQHDLMNYLGVSEKTQPYVHATYLFSNSCKPFIEECFNISQELLKKGISPPNYDETIYNVMLWKYGSNDYVTTYDPYYDYFLNRHKSLEHGYNNIPVNFYSCHGIKDPDFAKKILNKIILES
jgi:hypothetical protein